MTHTYKVSGMTCESCEGKVKQLLSQVKNVTAVKVDRTKNEAEISMSTHIDTPTLQNALKDSPRYQLSDKELVMHHAPVFEEEQKTWIQTYKPILLVFAFITGVTFLIQTGNEEFHWMQWMNHFMAGFFLVFSFFKLLNLQGFADSYSNYDIIAKRFKLYGYAYPFIELALGIAYLTDFVPCHVVNITTFAIMSIGLIGVLQSVLNKRKIKCACLGDVFNLPMSTITIIEDALMILMALFMLLKFYSII